MFSLRNSAPGGGTAARTPLFHSPLNQTPVVQKRNTIGTGGTGAALTSGSSILTYGNANNTSMQSAAGKMYSLDRGGQQVQQAQRVASPELNARNTRELRISSNSPNRYSSQSCCIFVVFKNFMIFMIFYKSICLVHDLIFPFLCAFLVLKVKIHGRSKKILEVATK